MELYFSPLACSMASRIVIYEAGAEDAVRFHHVDVRRKRIVADDSDYLAINALGQVPVLRTGDGKLLTENAAILAYLANEFPQANLGGLDDERYELARWLSFISTELHKVVFSPLLSKAANEGAKEYARAAAPVRLAALDEHLNGREFLLYNFSIADALLIAVLNWAPAVNLDLGAYPAVSAYRDWVNARPSVARALGEEMQLYAEARASAAKTKVERVIA